MTVLQNMTTAAILVVALLSHVTVAHVYSQCELANDLKNRGMPGSIPDWVCLIFAESSYNTAAEGHLNSDGSVDYGLFQINSRYWCGQGYAGGGCNVNCYSLLDDDISDDVACVKIIYAQSGGFTAWNGWKSSCQNGLPNLSGC
nr:unnamed protein product [Timema genevievae]